LAEIWKEKAGANSAQYANCLAYLGRCLLMQNKHAEAEAVLRDCLAIRVKKEPDAWTTFNTKSALGGSLLGQKKYAAPEPLLLEGYQGLKEREAKILPSSKSLTESLERLVQLYESWEKNDQAAEWRRTLEAHRKAQEKKAQSERK